MNILEFWWVRGALKICYHSRSVHKILSTTPCTVQSSTFYHRKTITTVKMKYYATVTYQAHSIILRVFQSSLALRDGFRYVVAPGRNALWGPLTHKQENIFF